MQNTEALLQALADAEVRFVVIGGVAAHVHGSQVFTADLNVLMPFDGENCARLIAALRPFAPTFHHADPPRQLPAKALELAAFRSLYLDTALGRIDVLGAMPPVGDFAAVAASAEQVEMAGRLILVVSLADLIAVKQATGRPKDAVVAAELRAVAARRAGGQGLRCLQRWLRLAVNCRAILAAAWTVIAVACGCRATTPLDFGKPTEPRIFLPFGGTALVRSIGAVADSSGWWLFGISEQNQSRTLELRAAAPKDTRPWARVPNWSLQPSALHAAKSTDRFMLVGRNIRSPDRTDGEFARMLSHDGTNPCPDLGLAQHLVASVWRSRSRWIVIGPGLGHGQPTGQPWSHLTAITDDCEIETETELPLVGGATTAFGGSDGASWSLQVNSLAQADLSVARMLWHGAQLTVAGVTPVHSAPADTSESSVDLTGAASKSPTGEVDYVAESRRVSRAVSAHHLIRLHKLQGQTWSPAWVREVAGEVGALAVLPTGEVVVSVSGGAAGRGQLAVYGQMGALEKQFELPTAGIPAYSYTPSVVAAHENGSLVWAGIAHNDPAGADSWLQGWAVIIPDWRVVKTLQPITVSRDRK